jgi:hypothetical protein
LRFEHRLLHLDADSCHDTVPDIGVLEVTVIELLDYPGGCLPESGEVRSSLRGVLPVHERVVLLAVLVSMGDGHLDIFAVEVDDGVQLLGGEVLVEQVLQPVLGVVLLAVKNDG